MAFPLTTKGATLCGSSGIEELTLSIAVGRHKHTLITFGGFEHHLSFALTLNFLTNFMLNFHL